MLINKQEYQAMFDVEQELWWYQILHSKVISAIQKKYSNKLDISILDAGCGTGGLLYKLRTLGYNNIRGFDYNEHAVALSKSRNLNVKQQDITNFIDEYKTERFDVIINNDVMYQFETLQIKKIFKDLGSLLNPDGIFISNNNSFEAFRGIHDIATGSKKRFTKNDFLSYITGQNLKIHSASYWSYFLSPLILSIRVFQKIQLKLGIINLDNITSDVAMPPSFLNKLFLNIVKIEQKISSNYPFGSSLFIVFKK